MTIRFSIDKYTVHMESGKSSDPDLEKQPLNTIHLFEKNRVCAFIWFVPDGIKLQEANYVEEGNFMWMAFNLSQFESILKILKNNSLIDIIYYTDRHGKKHGSIISGYKNIGDDELKRIIENNEEYKKKFFDFKDNNGNTINKLKTEKKSIKKKRKVKIPLPE